MQFGSRFGLGSVQFVSSGSVQCSLLRLGSVQFDSSG